MTQADEKKIEALLKKLETFGITTEKGTETIPALKGTETADELADILVQAKADAKEDGPKKKISKVVFTRKDGSKREFSETVHGEDFVEIADEFAETNKNVIASREELKNEKHPYVYKQVDVAESYAAGKNADDEL